MAATAHPGSFECAQCGGDRDPQASVAGSFCSTECYDAHRREKAAREILNQLKYDHRFCYTCFRRLKEVTPPPEGWGVSDAAIGFQYRTEHANVGEKQSERPEDGPERSKHRSVRTGTICKCGNTDHKVAVDDLRARFRLEYSPWLHKAISELRSEDKHGHDVAWQALDQALIENRVEDALPKAIQLR